MNHLNVDLQTQVAQILDDDAREIGRLRRIIRGDHGMADKSCDCSICSEDGSK